ncbi:DUF2157 domain-containing protein [Mesorhizobium sp. LHD-90]|uniref:DUF2157 domain-containing protein n=1 Tax=Mesorhizobium sp. LHD-90 TaxID=3071414 RepID=UPI0027E0C2F6|nr:DUF2157 domain-containing protein [Mesorhizobium sp. LHD-90]MDQ6432946.1 DUF2157 domain-containing protein [Mesorhizobium sp. LHD-90]
MGYSKRLSRDIERWIGQGLIDHAAGAAMLRDAEANDRRSFSFGFVLMMMAALLLGAAVLLVVASNWEAIPRLTRVVLLFALIFAGYIGGALLKLRGHDAFAEGAWLIAAAAFGGGIALIGQMYHLSGDEEAAILTWCAGTGLAAILLRSGPLTIAAAGIAASWLFTEGFDIWGRSLVPLSYPLVAAALWAVSLWTRSVAARHLLVLSLIAYAAMLAIDGDVTLVASCLAALSLVVLVASIFAGPAVESAVQLDGRLPLHALLGFLTGAAMLQLEHTEDPAMIVAAALVVFAVIAGTVFLLGRDSRGLRWLAYLGFAFELCFLYVATIGTMLGTAGLLLAVGLVLAVAAFLIIRIERRMKMEPA